MRKIIILALLFISCATPQRVVTSDYDDPAAIIRSLLNESSATVAVTTFDTLTVDQVIGKECKEALMASEVPLMETLLERYRNQVVSAFRETVVAMPSIIEPVTETLGTNDPTLKARKGIPVSGSFILLKKEIIKNSLEPALKENLEESQKTLTSIMRGYEINSRALTALDKKTPENVSALDFDALLNLFLLHYTQAMEQEEMKLRTTPQRYGVGSFYEYFSHLKEDV